MRAYVLANVWAKPQQTHAYCYSHLVHRTRFDCWVIRTSLYNICRRVQSHALYVEWLWHILCNNSSNSMNISSIYTHTCGCDARTVHTIPLQSLICCMCIFRLWLAICEISVNLYTPHMLHNMDHFTISRARSQYIHEMCSTYIYV